MSQSVAQHLRNHELSSQAHVPAWVGDHRMARRMARRVRRSAVSTLLWEKTAQSFRGCSDRRCPGAAEDRTRPLRRSVGQAKPIRLRATSTRSLASRRSLLHRGRPIIIYRAVNVIHPSIHPIQSSIHPSLDSSLSTDANTPFR